MTNSIRNGAKGLMRGSSIQLIVIMRSTLSKAVLALLIICGLLLTAGAQKPSADDSASPSAAIVATLADNPSLEPTSQMSSAIISGTVLDSNGSEISGAKVSLTGAADRDIITDSDGQFTFSGLASGAYQLKVSGPGMGTILVPRFLLLPGEVKLLPKVTLPVAESEVSIRVIADQEQLAQEQVHLELEQRVFGIFPNFYSSYDWNAVPLRPKQKFHLAFRSIVDPLAFVGAAGVAGVQQFTNSFPGYGQDVPGYFQRFGAAYANDVTGRMLGSAILPSLFHQDPRYFYKGSGNIRSRALYALSSAVICRGDNGRSQPDYSRVLGNLGAGGISNLYYPSGSRGASLTLVNALIEIAGNAGTNLFREFLLRQLTTKVPTYNHGKP